MGSWRVLVMGWGLILALCLAVGSETALPAVVPPLAAAAVVLVAAALASDYFGLARRATPWRGQVAATPVTRTRAAALEQRFRREREAGSMRTGATARALLVALAELEAWPRAADVVDFLGADAMTRAHRDVVADALRALALAELGREARARRVLDALGPRPEPVVAWAWARIAMREGRVAEALAATALAADGAGGDPVVRDLALVRVRLLARTGAGDDARALLTRLAGDGFRREVEALVHDRDVLVGLAAAEALGLRSTYRAA